VCGYSLHAVARVRQRRRDASFTTNVSGAGDRGLLPKTEPKWRFVMTPGDELASQDAVAYEDDLRLEKEYDRRVCSLSQIEPRCVISANDAIESRRKQPVLVTQLRKGQRATVRQITYRSSDAWSARIRTQSLMKHMRPKRIRRFENRDRRWR